MKSSEAQETENLVDDANNVLKVNLVTPTAPPIAPPKQGTGEWPIFISYRRSPLTSEIAKWLKEELEKEPIESVSGQVFRLNAFVDSLEPVHGDFQKYLVPHLEHSRMLIVITDSGSARRHTTSRDYLYDELDWWARKRPKTAPILLDTDRRSAAALVTNEKQFKSWGKSSWLECYWTEWQTNPSVFQRESGRLLRVIRESVRTYGHDIHLAEVRRLRRLLNWVIRFAAVTTLAAIGIGVLAFQLNRTLATSEARRYGLSTNTGALAIKNEDYASARTALGESPHSLRGWEWRHLWRKSDSSEKNWMAHPDGARGIVFSRDEKTLYSTGRDGCLRAWNVDNGLERFTVCLPIEPRPGDEAIQAVLLKAGIKPKPAVFGPIALSPNGEILAAGTARGALTFWNATDGRQIAVVDSAHEQSILEVVFASNETLLTAGQEGTLLAWDLKSTPPRSRIIDVNEQPVLFSLSADRARLATAVSRMSEADSPTTATFFSVDKELNITRLRGGRVSPDLVSSIVYAGPNHSVVAADFQGNLIYLEENNKTPNVKSAVSPRLKGIDAILSLTATSDGTILASGAKGGTIKLWNVANKSLLRVLPGHKSGVSRLCFSHSGTKLASAADDGEIRLWSVLNSAAAEQIIRLDFDAWAMSIHPDGATFAVSGHEGIICFFNGADGTEIGRAHSDNQSRIDWLQYSPDGRSMVSIDEFGKLMIWKTKEKTGKSIELPQETKIKQAFFNPDDKLIVLVEPGVMETWDPSEPPQSRQTSDEIVNPIRVLLPIVQIDCASNPIWHLAMARQDGLIEFVNKQGKISSKLSTPLVEITCLAATSDGHLLAAANSDELICWAMSSRSQVMRIKRPHESPIRSLAFSPDSHRLCSGSEDSTCKVWDVDQSIGLYQTDVLEGIVFGVGFLNDGCNLLITPCDSSVHILRTASP